MIILPLLPAPQSAPGGRLPGPGPLILASALALLALLAGLPLSGGVTTTLACLAMLVFGLPHGALDLELIRSRLSGPWTGMVSLVLLYLGLAGVMYGLWRVQPVLALAAFIAISVVHFAEDWDGAGSRMLEAGLALALLASPTLLHRSQLDLIFAGLTGRSGASLVTDALSVMAPVAIGLALIALLSLWRTGRRAQAVGGGVALIGMVLLPPIAGFALYFCLFHSPRHFRASLGALDRAAFRSWGPVVIPLTLAAGAIAALLFGLEVRAASIDRITAASFMTLSILTVPHMLAPLLVARLAGAVTLRRANQTG